MTFNTAEQFYMYCKAALFDDLNVQARLLATRDAKEQKRLGGVASLRGFDAARWDGVKVRVVEVGNMAKFGQNPQLRKVLLDSGDKVLCEAAGEDRIWGIGFSEAHARRHGPANRVHWGQNLLGRALMVVRERLRLEE